MSEQPEKHRKVIIAPSQYFIELLSVPFVNYSALSKGFLQFFTKENLDETDEFHGRPLNESVKTTVDALDKTDILNSLSEPSETIKQLSNFIKERIGSDEYRFITGFWPPIFMSTKKTTVHYLLLKIIQQSKKPEEIIRWISKSALPLCYTRFQKTCVIAFCRARIGKKLYWASLQRNEDTDEKSIHMIRYKEDGKVADEIKGKVMSITYNKNKEVLQVSNGVKIFTSFAPVDEEQVPLWENVMKDPPPIYSFFTSFSTPAPSAIYEVAYYAIANADAAILRTCISIYDASIDSALPVLNAFLNIFNYAKKVPTFIDAVVLADLENYSSNIDEFFKKKHTHISNLCKIIFGMFTDQKMDMLVTKLVNYISSTIMKEKMSTKTLEKVISNTVKFITKSYSDVPPQIVHVLSVVRSFLLIYKNTRASIYSALSKLFFIDYLLPLIEEKGGSSIPSSVYRLFQVVFSMGQMIDEFSDLMTISRRFERHVYPSLLNFIVTISEARDAPEYGSVEAPILSHSIDIVLKAISAEKKTFHEKCKFLVNPANPTNAPGLLGTCYAAYLANFFVHAFDINISLDSNEQKSEDTEEDFSCKVIENIIKNSQVEGIDPTKPRKYYKRVNVGTV